MEVINENLTNVYRDDRYCFIHHDIIRFSVPSNVVCMIRKGKEISCVMCEKEQGL